MPYALATMVGWTQACTRYAVNIIIELAIDATHTHALAYARREREDAREPNICAHYGGQRVPTRYH
jgi:hypothetical protein